VVSETLCATIHELYALWEHHSNTLADEVERRVRNSNKFSEKELMEMVKGMVDGLVQLEESSIVHERLSLQSIKLSEGGAIKITDPISLNCNSNFARLYAHHQTPRTAYLSPE
jgi:hypothetical protein